MTDNDATGTVIVRHHMAGIYWPVFTDRRAGKFSIGYAGKPPRISQTDNGGCIIFIEAENPATELGCAV